MKTVKRKPTTEKEYLTNLLDQFTKIQIDTKGKIERYEVIMNRKSSKNWDNAKKKKMSMGGQMSSASLPTMLASKGLGSPLLGTKKKKTKKK